MLGAQSVLDDLAQPSPVAYPKAKSEFPSFPVAIENSLFRLRCSVVRLNKMSEGEVEEEREGESQFSPSEMDARPPRLLFFSSCMVRRFLKQVRRRRRG